MVAATLIKHEEKNTYYANRVRGALYKLPNLIFNRPYEKRHYSFFTDEETEVIKYC